MEVADFVLGCPNGWAFNGIKCTGVLTSDAQQACDEGQDILMDENTGIQCIQKMVAPKIISCPDNYLLIDNECALPMHSKPDLICPEAFIPLSNGNCQKDIRLPAALECPPEYVLSNGECEKRDEIPVSNINKVCPLGFLLDINGDCTKQINMNAKFTCQEGYERSPLGDGENGCVRSIIIDAKFRCLQDYELIDNKCIKKLTNVPLISCEKDYVLQENNQCVKQTKLPAKYECPKKKDYMFNSQTKLCHSTSHHHSQKTHQPILICPIGSIPQGNDHCLSIEKKDPKIDCLEAGWTFDENTKLCIHNEYTTASFECPLNSQNIGNGKCRVMETASTDIECPPEFQYEGNGLCISRIQADPQIKCPNGSSPTPQGTCLKIELISPKPLCPEGLKPSITVMDGQIPLCIGREIVPKQETCPPNYELVTTSETGLRRCRTYKKSEPIIACANGFVEDTQGCLQTITSSPRLLCPEDYVLQYSRCIKQVEDMPNKMCPAGFELSDDQCNQIVYSKPIPNCPDDYMFDNIVKRCFKIDIQYDFASLDTTVIKQNFTNIVQPTNKQDEDDNINNPDSEENKQNNMPYQNIVVNGPNGRYAPYPRMLPPQTQPQSIRPPPIQSIYPQTYPQLTNYPVQGGNNLNYPNYLVPSQTGQYPTGAAGYGYPFPGFQQYAPAPRLTNSPSYPVYMRSLSQEKNEL